MLLFTASSDAQRIARPAGPWGLAVPMPLRALKGRPRSQGSGVSRHGYGYGYGFPGLADGLHRFHT